MTALMPTPKKSPAPKTETQSRVVTEASVPKFTPKQLLQVEEFGRSFEQGGMAPMPSRLFALLLIAEPAYMEFFAIQDALQASKSAVSSAIKVLHEKLEIVNYRTFPGDRRRYFYVDFDKWHDAARKSVETTLQVQQLLEKVAAGRQKAEPAFDRRLEEMIAFYKHLDIGLQRIMTEWEAKKHRSGRDN